MERPITCARPRVIISTVLMLLIVVPVMALTLVDPRYYHLDTALAVLAPDTIMYYPPAFSAGSRSPISESSIERAFPISRGNSQVAPQSGTRPMRRNACRK